MNIKPIIAVVFNVTTFHSWEENWDAYDDETISQACHRVIDNFNKTVNSGESERVWVKARWVEITPGNKNTWAYNKRELDLLFINQFKKQ